MPAIQSDAALLNEYPDAIEGDDAFMDALFGDNEDAPSEPSEKPEEDEETNEDRTNDDADETDEDADDDQSSDEDKEGDDEDEETEADPKAKAKKFADDDETYVKVKEGDTEHEVSVKDLKRLYGQEAALTRRSQEVADARKAVDEDRAKNIAAYDVLLKRATERANEYRALPWTELMRNNEIPTDQLTALQAEAKKAFEDEAFLQNELGGFMQKVQEEQRVARATAARECIKALTTKDSPHHIAGWSQDVYNDIRSFATSSGVPAETVNAITDPAAIKILHMAMQFSRGQSKVVTKKVNKTPTKIVKNSASAPAARASSKTVTAKTAVTKATKTGNINDAAAAFEALFD
ncbi:MULTISPECIES: hypothetical protein [unclassified Bradyrhizobium]|uniref:hypothetical protein n=1 Tax=unclassified Bradyrhizobium TaxID=2631580 RepID=UPI002916EED0|nr:MULTISPECIES: hypothetical protein [unclassified Bradyrhizobium]